MIELANPKQRKDFAKEYTRSIVRQEPVKSLNANLIGSESLDLLAGQYALHSRNMVPITRTLDNNLPLKERVNVAKAALKQRPEIKNLLREGYLRADTIKKAK